MNTQTVATTFVARVRLWLGLLAPLWLLGCVDHPTEGVTDQSTTQIPWNETYKISGALPVAQGRVEIEVATDKEATAFVSLGLTQSGTTPVVDPSFPEYFPWQRANTAIPQQYWFPGVSKGYTARLRAWFRSDDAMVADYMLGSPEHFNTPQVCMALQQNPNAFAAIGPALESACLSTPSDYELTFAFLTPGYNDHCGNGNEACCAPPSAPCATGLVCKENNRCGAPDAPPSNDPPGGMTGTGDSEKCEEGKTEAASFTPEGCDPSFTVTGFKKCVNGKFRDPSAVRCNTDTDPPAGSECYCDTAGGACGTAAGQPCGGTNPPATKGLCRPGAGCIPVNGQWLCTAAHAARTPTCWKKSDVVDLMVSDPSLPPDPTCPDGTPDGFGRCCPDNKKDSFGNCPTSSGSGGSGGTSGAP